MRCSFIYINYSLTERLKLLKTKLGQFQMTLPNNYSLIDLNRPVNLIKPLKYFYISDNIIRSGSVFQLGFDKICKYIYWIRDEDNLAYLIFFVLHSFFLSPSHFNITRCSIIFVFLRNKKYGCVSWKKIIELTNFDAI